MVDPDNPRDPVPVVMAKLPWDAALWKWIKDQGFAIAILCVAVGMLWAEIKAGKREAEETVKEVASKNAEAIKQITLTHAQTLEKQAQVFQSEQDRTERILGNKINAVARKVAEFAP